MATLQSDLCGFKVVYILRAYMSVFDDPASLRGQSFGYGLAPLDPVAEDSEIFVETRRLGLFIDEQGMGHVSGPLRLYASTDPIDCEKVPTFSKDNLFIRGVYESIYRDVVPTTDGTLNLGNVSRPWKSVYAKEFVSDSIALSGNLIFKGAKITDKFAISYALGAFGPALQLYQGGVEKFQVNEKGVDVYGNLTTNSINDGPLAGFRNLAINGNFDIWQRGTTNTGTVGVVGTFRVADRWVSGINPSAPEYSPSGSFTVSQQNCTSTEFSYFNASFYQRLTHTNVNFGTNLNTLVNDSASSVLAIQSIENAFSVLGKTVTLSFWARASASTKIVSEQQIYSLTAPFWSPTICKTFDLTTTWQKFTHTYTIPTYSQVIAAGYDPSTVNTTLTNPTYTPKGEAATLPLVDWLFQIDIKTAWCLGEWRKHGNAYSGSRPSGFEGTEQTLAEMQNMNNSFIANGYYDIAQVQLELGPVATPFEKRPIGTELALCQRYFCKSYEINTPPGTPEIDVGNPNSLSSTSLDLLICNISFPVTMRSSPSITIYRPSTGAVGTIEDTFQANPAAAIYLESGSNGIGLLRFDPASSAVGTSYQFQYTASAEL